MSPAKLTIEDFIRRAKEVEHLFVQLTKSLTKFY